MGGSSVESKMIGFLMIAVVVVVAAAAPAEAAISCSGVVSRLSSCLTYLQKGDAMTVSCCDGVRALNNDAATTPDRQAVCGCIKSLAPGAGAKPEFINSLPGKCGLTLPYHYSPSMDCSKVQ